MNKTKAIFGIGMALAVLAVFTAPATAYNVFHLTPQNSNCTDTGCTVDVWINLSTNHSDVGGAEVKLCFDPNIVSIKHCVEVPEITDWSGGSCYRREDHVSIFACAGYSRGLGPGELVVRKITLECTNAGTSPLKFDLDRTHVYDDNWDSYPERVTVEDGTFTCLPPVETFSKDLVAGLGLISLPLKAKNMTVASVFSSITGKYKAVYEYDAETKHFVVLSDDDVLENGVGYIIYLTSNGTWAYEGRRFTNMTVPLKKGLNMVGWTNTSASLPDALQWIAGSYSYVYVARWNATSQNYEVYMPPLFVGFTMMDRGEGYFIFSR